MSAESPTRRRAPRGRRLIEALFPPPARRRLPNGLEVVLAQRAGAPVVSTALVYHAGCRNDPDSFGGTAHFLEHLMFRGASEFGDGAIDRLTRRLGGHNNAFTGHDSTTYELAFAADQWRHALAIEADRMSGLMLAPEAIENERAIILEEWAMYEDDPWDALGQAVFAALFPEHPYGRPVLGSRDEIQRTDEATLRGFHSRWYGPGNAALVIVGGFGDVDETFDAVVEAFASVAPRRAPGETPADTGAPTPGRVERRQGEVARLLVALPAPSATHPDHPHLRLATSVLGSGRASRLQRDLVETGTLAAGVSYELQESVDPGTITFAAEVLPGVEPRQVEEALRTTIARFLREPPKRAEVARARRMLLADWVFDHDRVHQQAQRLAHNAALGDLDLAARWWHSLHDTEPDTLHAVARRWLDLDRAVVGWSLPEGEPSAR